MGITKQVDHSLLILLLILALALQQQFLGSEQVGRDDLFGNFLSFAVHVERSTSLGVDGIDLVIFEILQTEGSTHGMVCTYGTQRYMEAHLPFASPLVGNTQNAVVIVEVQVRIVGHLFLIAIDECQRLRDVCHELLGIKGVREVHLIVVGREFGDCNAPLVIDECGIECSKGLGIAEAQEGRFTVGNHHLRGYFGIRTLTRVGSQNLQPLGIHVDISLHRDASGVCQNPSVIVVYGVNRRQTVADGLCGLRIKQFMVRAASAVHYQDDSHYQWNYPSKMFHNFLLNIIKYVGKITKIIAYKQQICAPFTVFNRKSDTSYRYFD